MLTLFHGGMLASPDRRLWLTPDRDYAAAFAELYDQEFIWAVTIDLEERDILDVSSCGLVSADVVTELRRHGLAPEPSTDAQPHHVLWRLSDEQIRGAGFRAVRLLESADWGKGTLPTMSLCLVDPTAIYHRSMIRLASDSA